MSEILICILVVVIILIVFREYSHRESFIPLDEKADTLAKWFYVHDAPTYDKFIRENVTSNIVEFKLLYNLWQNNELTEDAARKALAI
ncbi:MAG: hypothetical protein M0R33_18850 [Methylomonas sp.]|jgi:hypothetical protein|uniref:hypothetical protein n=1 Tax=Methylomonas sp. TaxID=418 RepID=UPI0025F9B1EC|nr:hypothetical protein [Methylomonas sp.]MCK9608504.1 hypothetical protein [Methylomonas sp.]